MPAMTQTAAAGTRATDAGSRPSPADVARVAGFLTHCRGLASLGDDELDALFRTSQIDATLAGLPSEAANAPLTALPTLEDIPDQDVLHDLVLGGFVPHGHQMIAHILYPDAVRWPFDPQSRRQLQVETGGDSQSGSPTRSPTQQLTPSPRRRQQLQQSQQQISSNSRCSGPAVGGSSSSGRSHSRERHATSGGTGSHNTQEEAEDEHTIEICGLKVASTVRGRSLQEQHERSVILSQLDEPDDRRYKAAREKRERAEKAAKLEEYHERTLQARIKELEDLRAAEIAKREALQARETSRRAHHEVLKRKIEENYELEIQRDKAKKDMEEEQKSVKAKAEALAKQYHKQQKERLDNWWAAGDNDDVESRRAKAKERHEEHLNKKKLRDAEKQLVTRTDKQKEVVEKVQKLHALVQERPPLPLPRQHDLPRPLVMQPAEKARAVTARSELTSMLTPRRTPRQGSSSRVPSQGHWKSEAKLISNVYGLSDRDTSAVHSHLSRGISGAGRMAEYEKQPRAVAVAVAA